MLCGLHGRLGAQAQLVQSALAGVFYDGEQQLASDALAWAALADLKPKSRSVSV